jgi:hypothetical protein
MHNTSNTFIVTAAELAEPLIKLALPPSMLLHAQPQAGWDSGVQCILWHQHVHWHTPLLLNGAGQTPPILVVSLYQ